MWYDGEVKEASAERVVAGSSLGAATCDEALARAFTLLGKRWNGVILGTLTTGPAGFAELGRGVGGICDSVLSERLGELQLAGLVVRTVEPGPPVAVSYALSDTGAALIPVLHALGAWASEHLATPPT